MQVSFMQLADDTILVHNTWSRLKVMPTDAGAQTQYIADEQPFTYDAA